MVFNPLTAAKATLAFSGLVNIFRLLSLIIEPFFMTGYSLNYCPEFGVHYRLIYHQQMERTRGDECSDDSAVFGSGYYYRNT